MSFRLILPLNLFTEMVEHARTDRPNECCGILAGVVSEGIGLVQRRYPLVNSLASPTEYEAEPRSLLAAYREIHSLSLEILAIYHSHPTTHPIPSKKDLERLFSEEVICVILSLIVDPPEVRAWWLTATDYREAEWSVEGSADPS